MNSIDRYAVIGHGLGHSRSPQIHGLFAQSTGQSMNYGLIDVPAAGFGAAVRDFFAGGGRGLNVTVPHKEAALALAQRLTPRARRAGAVNTLAAGADAAALLGDNTDGAGLVRDLTVNLGYALTGARVLLLGAGGAARGVIAPLLQGGVGELRLQNRNPARARQLAQEFADLGPIIEGGTPADAFDLIINATSASLRGEVPLIAAQACGPRTLCYDLAYGPGETAFMRWARTAGAAGSLMGLGMLVEQAAESFLLWRGVRPDTAPVLAQLRQDLGS
jgi:shikimate dehydrogenase